MVNDIYIYIYIACKLQQDWYVCVFSTKMWLHHSSHYYWDPNTRAGGIEEQGGTTTDTIRRSFVNNQNGVYRTGQTRLVCKLLLWILKYTKCIKLFLYKNQSVSTWRSIVQNVITKSDLGKGGRVITLFHRIWLL